MMVKLIGYYPNAEEVCGQGAAICVNSDDLPRSLKGALLCGHESVVEHAPWTFLITGVSRVLLAQITRHRLASFSVQSQRYVNQTDADVTIPPSIMAADKKLLFRVQDFLGESFQLYTDLVDAGIPQEDARFVLTEATHTAMVVTMNTRQLRHFFSLRMCRRAQWEIRQLAEEMYKLVYPLAPTLFKDAGPGCVRGACPEGKKCCGMPRVIKEGAVD